MTFFSQASSLPLRAKILGKRMKSDDKVIIKTMNTIRITIKSLCYLKDKIGVIFFFLRPITGQNAIVEPLSGNLQILQTSY